MHLYVLYKILNIHYLDTSFFFMLSGSLTFLKFTECLPCLIKLILIHRHFRYRITLDVTRKISHGDLQKVLYAQSLLFFFDKENESCYHPSKIMDPPKPPLTKLLVVSYYLSYCALSDKFISSFIIN